MGAHYDFRWDDNGNLTDSRAYATHTDRRLCWTEDNRLQAFMEQGDEGGIAAYYNYSAEGERNIKLTSPRLNMQQNATLFSNPPLVYPTLYASSLVTLTKQGYTKHYFEEGRRICSKIGGGIHGNVTVEEIDSRVPELTYRYDEQFHHQYDGIRYTFSECIEADPQIIDGVNLHRMLIEREIRRNEEEPAFFYHSDHLGSAAYLTYHGGVVQTLNYLPYGEDWVELNFFAPHDTTRLGIYRFNGKEKDYESGFHYYGARYYWSEVLTGWLSVDPLTDKFPSVSGYSYCINNPVILIDPDGNSPIKGITSAIKIAKEAYNIYKKTGKLTPKALKSAGLSELVDIAGDMVTIFSGDASVLDRISAVADLVIGTNLNQKGNNIVAKKGTEIVNKITKRESPRTSRTKWEKKTGEKWPKDPDNPSRNQDVSHKKPLADGGTNDVDNIEPKPHSEHMQEHMQRGDFNRRGQRSNNKSND